MKDWPPVLIVSGSEGYLRRCFVNQVIEEVTKAGRIVDSVDGSQPGALEGIISTGDFLAAETLVIVTNPQKVRLQTIEDHNALGDSTYLVLLHVEGSLDGRTKFGKLVKKLDKQHRAFPSPPSWKADEIAVDFCRKEAESYGKTMSQRTASALVSVIGPDLGLLHFEVYKAATLAEARGDKTIETLAHVKGTVATLAEVDVFPAIRALGDLNFKRALRGFDRVKKTSRHDPTMKVCRALGATAIKWLAAAHLHAAGYAPDEAADIQGQKSAWYYENKILPPALAWGVENLLKLVHAVALSERAILDGHVDPWTGFMARLAGAFPKPS